MRPPPLSSSPASPSRCSTCGPPTCRTHSWQRTPSSYSARWPASPPAWNNWRHRQGGSPSLGESSRGSEPFLSPLTGCPSPSLAHPGAANAVVRCGQPLKPAAHACGGLSGSHACVVTAREPGGSPGGLLDGWTTGQLRAAKGATTPSLSHTLIRLHASGLATLIDKYRGRYASGRRRGHVRCGEGRVCFRAPSRSCAMW